MNREKVNIRDPYILLHEGIYYLYGTRSATCWGEADGFDCYKSEDLEKWEGPIEIFRRPEGFFADRNYRAPECYFVNGYFYLVTTFEAQKERKGFIFFVPNNRKVLLNYTVNGLRRKCGLVLTEHCIGKMKPHI